MFNEKERRSEVMRRNNRRNAFSLIELLLVLVILAVLAALIVPKFTGVSGRAREGAAKTDIGSIESAINRFEIDNGRFPSNDEGLAALESAPADAKAWSGPYLKLKKDPWGKDYVYRYPSQIKGNDFDVYSFGPDGREGNDDIGNWESDAAK
jgi:general secretion pathway protein G